MKRIFWVTIFVCLSLESARGGEREITTFAQYKKDSPVILQLSYRGGIPGWDGAAVIGNGTLILLNAMYISITNSKDETAKPKKDKVLSIWADTYFRNPFDLVLDISRFYNLSRPGKYIVEWGCKDVKNDRIYIEITDR